jgi:hypothetical protein
VQLARCIEAAAEYATDEAHKAALLAQWREVHRRYWAGESLPKGMRAPVEAESEAA